MKSPAIGSVIAITLIISACAFPLSTAPEPTALESDWHCPPVPATFQGTDLVGTWESWYFPGSVTDTIVLQEGGTFQEIYVDLLANIYLSVTGTWYLETKANGGLYLHLEGMRYHIGGGTSSGVYYDRCSGELVGTIDEVILAVTGDEGFRFPRIESVPRGILLWHMRIESDMPDNFFILQE